MAKSTTAARMTLAAETAADLMVPNPVSIRGEATIREAVRLLTDKGISAAPVIDKAGRPVGVLSQTDILVHARERTTTRRSTVHDYYRSSDLSGPEDWGLSESDELKGTTRVSDIMTPVVFSVTPATPTPSVVEQMLGTNVHRLFVVTAEGVLVGVISTTDILRRLRKE